MREGLPGRADCRRFTGYKPCAPGKLCETCPDPEPFGQRVLLIALDALGAVIQATSLLPAIHREWGPATVTWVTLPGHLPALENNPHVWRALPYDFETIHVLERRTFDLVANVDKTARSAALAEAVAAKRKCGFGLTPNGQIAPFNAGAEALYRLGLDDDWKFRRNTRPATSFLAEALELRWRRDPYVLRLTPEEKAFAADYRRSLGAPRAPVVGYNTGCSALFPNKKMTVEQHVELIARVREAWPTAVQALLGGPAETERNREIAARAGGIPVETPTTEGLRRGMQYVAACDIVVTGDTSALHMAVALGRFVVAWFGMTCAAEIDLYDRGVKIVSGHECAPCWKRACDDLRCLRELSLDAILEGIRQGLRQGARPAPVVDDSGIG